MTSDPEHSKHLPAALFPIGMALGFLAILVGFRFTLMPQNWLGGGWDNYSYGGIIKAYLNTWSFASLDMEHPMNYPPYFFYGSALFGRLFHITDLGILSWLGWCASYVALPMGAYILLQPVLGPSRASAGVVLMFLASVASYHSPHIWTKPHEIFSLLSIPALILWLSYSFRVASASSRLLIFAGIVYGLCFGSYTPFVVVPTLTALLILGLALIGGVLDREVLRRLLDLRFLAPLILVTGPYVLTVIWIFTHHDRGLGVVTWFRYQDMTFDFMRSLSPPHWSFFLAPLLALGFLLNAIVSRQFHVPVLFLALMVPSSIAIYTLAVEGIKHGVPSTAPFKYWLEIPLVCGLMLACLPIPWWLRRASEVISRTLHGYDREIASGFGVGMLSFGLAVSIMAVLYPKVSPVIALSAARSTLLGGCVKSIGGVRRRYEIERYLGEGEYSFLDYYVPGRFVNYIIYNESYASAYEDVPDRAKRLQESANAGPEKFYRQLLAGHIDTLVLNPSRSAHGTHSVDYIYNSGDRMEIPGSLVFSQALISKLETEKKLLLAADGDCQVYVVRRGR